MGQGPGARLAVMGEHRAPGSGAGLGMPLQGGVYKAPQASRGKPGQEQADSRPGQVLTDPTQPRHPENGLRTELRLKAPLCPFQAGTLVTPQEGPGSPACPQEETQPWTAVPHCHSCPRADPWLSRDKETCWKTSPALAKATANKTGIRLGPLLTSPGRGSV